MSPHSSPDYGMIAPDFLLLRVPATESIVVPMVEEARARRGKKGKQERIIW